MVKIEYTLSPTNQSARWTGNELWFETLHSCFLSLPWVGHHVSHGYAELSSLLSEYITIATTLV